MSAVSSGGDLWQWGGTSRVEIPVPPGGPSPRAKHGMVYDSARDRLVLFGGAVAGSPENCSNELWEWDRDPARRPAVQFTAVLADDLKLSELTGVSMRARTGATAAPSATGATLFGWNTSSSTWKPIAAADAGASLMGLPLDEPAAWASFETNDPTSLRNLVSDSERSISLQLRPTGTAGDGGLEAALGVDYFEIRVRYMTDGGTP